MLRKFPRSLVGTQTVLWPYIPPRRCMSRAYEAHHESLAQSHPLPPPFASTSASRRQPPAEQRQEAQHSEESPENDLDEPLADFAALGIRRSVRLALHEAFPNIRTPTACQAAFIPALLSRKDVILKDWTGTGKSFGLVLALLSKARATRPHLSYKERTALAKRPITSLVVVPHRDLAFQLMHWIRMLCPHNHQKSLDSIAQVCVRGAGALTLDEQIKLLHDQAPHILIGTPNALVEIFEKNRSVLQIDTLETVVVDEVDYLLPVPNPGDSKKKHRNWTAHPPPTLRLLNELFKDRSKIARQDSSRPWRWPLQAVFASATLRHNLRRFFFGKTIWMDRYSQVVKIDFERENTQNGPGSVAHLALVVDEAGAVRNVKFQDGKDLEGLKKMPSTAPAKVEIAVTAPLLEAVATTFALDVPKVALLILPATASVTNVLKELQDMGVRARGMALHDEQRGKYEMMRSTLKKFNPAPAPRKRDDVEAAEEEEEEPTLLVATEASIRGLDLPELTHVFIIGVPEDEVSYNHAAGRVGRFGREGKVIVFLAAQGERTLVKETRGALGERVEEEERLRRLYVAVGVSPSTFEHVRV